MKRLLLTLLLAATVLPLAAQPDSLDYRNDYYFSKRDIHEGVPVGPENIVMLGNSLTERCSWAEYFQDARILNRGIGGDCVAGMAARIDPILQGRPRAIFLMAGVNDLIFSKITPEALLAQYERLLDRIEAESPETELFIESLLPLDEPRNTQYFTGKNARIEAFNRLLREMAARRGLVYIDIWSRMAHEGSMPSELTVDGIHLNAAGYKRWIEALTPYVTPAGARTGTVRCEGRGVEGVVVSDGDRCAVTDAAGRFVLPANDRARFLFVSTPAGYTSPVEQGVVRFFRPVTPRNDGYDFTLVRNTADDTRHGFAVIADPQLFDRKELRLLEGAAADIRRTARAAEKQGRPMHGICVGDITSGDHGFYGDYNRILATTGIGFRNAPGNHDMKLWGRSFERSTAAYEAVYGPSYYSYNVGRAHYVVLNDNFYIGRDWYYIGYIDERQLAWLEEDLAHVPAGSTLFVALHIPTSFPGKEQQPFLYPQAETSLCNFRALHELLAPYNAHILSGHMHTAMNCEIRPNLYEHNIAALSGAWWQGPVCTDGTPAGYALFEVDGDSVTWYYKATGERREYQLRLYDAADDPAYAGRIVANVWDSDPAWRIEVRIDGGEPLRMEPMRGVDPLALRLYGHPEQLDHKWITVPETDHLYAAPLPATARRVEVTARDRFGNVYRAEKHIKR